MPRSWAGTVSATVAEESRLSRVNNAMTSMARFRAVAATSTTSDKVAIVAKIPMLFLKRLAARDESAKTGRDVQSVFIKTIGISLVFSGATLQKNPFS